MPPHALSYGTERSLSLRFPSGTPIVKCSEPVTENHTNAQAATADALHNPLDFPSITSATVPGDQITIAVCTSLPCMQPIATKVIDMLLDASAQPEEITLLLPNESDVARYKSLGSIHAKIHLASHTPDERTSLGYIAASQQGNPVYFHRALCDADLVLPIEASLPSIEGYDHALHGKLFPTFSDTDTKFRLLCTTDTQARTQNALEAQEAAWLLGIQLVIQVVPGACNEALHVLAGQSEVVQKLGSNMSTKTWRTEIPEPADLVIGAIGGGPEMQNWEHVARALAASATVVQERGAIGLCTGLKEPPPPALKRMAFDLSELSSHDDRPNHTAEEELVVQRIRQTLQRASVYLVSELESHETESIGFTHVDDPQNLQRLCEQCDSCILVNNAQYAAPVLLQQETQTP
ncbi:MAG: lactate racemase domain-containing protein [Planctomycetota bacterium]|nr:lactate racemase domain-containing protein [Planctomycetota bacterium]